MLLFIVLIFSLTSCIPPQPLDEPVEVIFVTSTPFPTTTNTATPTAESISSTETPVTDLTPTLSTALPLDTPTISPITAIWKIAGYKCMRKSIIVVIEYSITGGVPPYKYTPPLPDTAKPGSEIKIKIDSNTQTGQPSTLMTITVPDLPSYNCPGSSINDGTVIPIITTAQPAAITTTVPPPIITTVAPPVITTVAPIIITTVAPPIITTVAPPIITTVAPPKPTDTPDFPQKECNDNYDNDGDGFIDDADPQCKNSGDNDESQ